MIFLIFFLGTHVKSEIIVSLAGTVLTVSGTGTIDENALRKQGDYTKFTEIIIKSGPYRIGARAFSRMVYLKHIHFSDTISTIESGAFNENWALNKFTIDKNNRHITISTDGNILMDINQEIIYKITNNPGEITIPSTATIIKGGCFGRTTISNLVIPANVKILEKQCFTDCNTNYIRFESNSAVTEIAHWVFYYAKAINELHIPAAVIKICNLAFQSATVGKIIFDEISNLTFLENSSLAHIIYQEGPIKLPSKITEIPPKCFESSTITQVNIPKNCSKIDPTSFQGCSSLSSVIVDQGNQYYQMIGETLYNKAKTELIFVTPSATSLSISKELETISNTLVQGLVNVNNITVDDENPNFSGHEGCLYNKTFEVLLGVCGGVKTLSHEFMLISVTINTLKKIE